MTPLDIAVRAQALLTRSRLAARAVAALAVATVFPGPAMAQPAAPGSRIGSPAS